MAILISAASGNLSGDTLFAPAETGAGSQQLTLTSSTTATTAYVYCPAFTITNGDVIDAVVICMTRTSTTASGTVSVALSADNGVTATREVTINVTDIGMLDRDWVCVKLGSSLTGTGASTYRVGVKSSVTSSVTVHRSSTAANWGRLLRRSATLVAAAAADQLFFVGEATGAGTGNNFAVTMNGTAAVNYGPIWVGNRGTLAYGTVAATNYVLQLAGELVIGASGTFTMGTAGTPMPRDSTATLQFDCASAGQYGLVALGTFSAYGQSRSAGKDISRCLLADNVAANGTTITLSADTGWLDNDEIAIASTTRTYTETEAGRLNGNAGASTAGVKSFAGTGGGVQYAHAGVAPTQAEVVLLTRNVSIKAVSASFCAFCITGTASAISLAWVEMRYLGEMGSHAWGGLKSALNVLVASTKPGTFAASHIVIRDGMAGGIQATGTGTVSVANVILYSQSTSSGTALSISVATQTWTDVCVMRCGFYSSSVVAALSAIASASGISFVGNSGSATVSSAGGSNWVSHSNGGVAATWTVLDIAGLAVWRNTNYVSIAAPQAGAVVSDLVSFGNGTYSVSVPSGGELTLLRPVLNSDTGYGTTYGIRLAGPMHNVVVVDGQISVASGSRSAHSTGDIEVSTTYAGAVTFINTVMAGSTEVSGQSNMSASSSISSHHHDQTVGNHVVWTRAGKCQSDTTIYKASAPSERLTPNSATYKLWSGLRSAGIDSGTTKTITVWVRKSASGDGAAYSGAQPRLMLKRNDGIGVTADTVLATMTAAVGNWEQLSGTTPTASSDGAVQVYVDCGGTVGWVNVDDWAVT